MIEPLAQIPVGVLVSRSKAMSQWTDYIWRPVAALDGIPGTPPWTQIDGDDNAATFYAGDAVVELHPTEASHYRMNLDSGDPKLWVILRPSTADRDYDLFLVTADPAEGEGMTEAAADLVETVPMPLSVQHAIAAFVDAHHVDYAFSKRKRDRANLEALGLRPAGEGKKP